MAKKAKEEKQRNACQKNTYQGVPIDLSDIDASNKLTDRAKRFVFWYCFPGTDCFQHKKRAAVAAGYAARTAAISGYKLCKNPQVIKEVDQLSKKFSSEAIDVLYRRYISALETRAFFDPADFISGKVFKPIEEIAPEKRLVLEQPIMDIKRGEIVGYEFGSRRQAMSEIKEIHSKRNPGWFSDTEDESLEIIMERITINEKRRAQYPPEMEGEIVEDPAETEDEDE